MSKTQYLIAFKDYNNMYIQGSVSGYNVKFHELSAIKGHDSFISELIKFMETNNLTEFTVGIITCDDYMYFNNPRIYIEPLDEYTYYVKLNEVTSEDEKEYCSKTFTSEQLEQLRRMIKWYCKEEKPKLYDNNKIDMAHIVFNKDHSNCHRVHDGEVVMLEVNIDNNTDILAAVTSYYNHRMLSSFIKLPAKYDITKDCYVHYYGYNDSVNIYSKDIISVTELDYNYGTNETQFNKKHDVKEKESRKATVKSPANNLKVDCLDNLSNLSDSNKDANASKDSVAPVKTADLKNGEIVIIMADKSYLSKQFEYVIGWYLFTDNNAWMRLPDVYKTIAKYNKYCDEFVTIFGDNVASKDVISISKVEPEWFGN